jgi:hypothetical protein
MSEKELKFKWIPCGVFWLCVPDWMHPCMSEDDFDRVIQTLYLFKKSITVPKDEIWTDGTWTP